MESDKPHVISSDISGACEVTDPKSEQAIVDQPDEQTVDESASQEPSEEPDNRWRTRVVRWLRKIWERECPLLPSDYFDHHGN